MKKKHLKLALIACAFATTLWSCNQGSSDESENDTEEVGIGEELGAQEDSDIQLQPIGHSKAFPDAELQIESMETEKAGDDSVKLTVKYTVSNFELTEMTDDENAEHMANSAEGQHIHFILDNEPYEALYAPEHTVTLALDSEHYLLSFLSRSFHEAIKTTEASQLVKFKITEDGKIEELPEPAEESLFYSRPKGEYVGEKETKNVLLDFFLENTNLSPDGNKVIAEINGQEFTIDSWEPHEITGAPLGDLDVKLTLVDEDGNAITGDNVSIERTSQLKED